MAHCCKMGGGAENAGVENAGVDCTGVKCRSNNVWKAVVENFMMTANHSGEKKLERLFASRLKSYLRTVRPVDLLSHFPTICSQLSCARRHALI